MAYGRQARLCPDGQGGSEEHAHARVMISRVGDQLVLPLEWGSEPWAGVSPRYLTKVYRETPCGVDNFGVGCPSREAQCFGPDPAQYTLFLKGTPHGS